MTDENVLSTLASLLNSTGIAATFDHDLMKLFFDRPILDSDTFVWGNTDTGLEFLTSFEGLAVAVSEPTSAGLVIVGLLGLLLAARPGRCRWKEQAGSPGMTGRGDSNRDVWGHGLHVVA